MKENLTIREVAQYLNVSISTVRRLIDAKNLKAYKVGSQYRIRREDVEAFFRDEGKKADNNT